MRIIILFPLSILIAGNAIAQQPKPTEKQLEQQKELNKRLLEDNKKAEKKYSENKTKSFIGATWTGTLSSEEKTIWKEGCISVTSERHAKVNFTAALPTMYRDVETTDFSTFTDNKGTGSADYHSEGNMCGNSGITDCTGTGVAELHAVTIREWDKTYDIEAIAPPCSGSNSDGTPYGPEVTEILVSNEPLFDKDHLAGTKSVTSQVPGTAATVTRTITWNLTTSDVVEPCLACGSVIGIENQSLGQSINITGTPFSLNYRSDRNTGSDGIGEWSLNVQHSLLGNRIYFGNGQELAIKYDLKPIAEAIPDVAPAGSNLVASSDGSEMYAFDESGNHLKTFDALTGAMIFEFQYDLKRQLSAVVNAYGQVTKIERSVNGLPSAIIGPYKHRTDLEFDKAGNLISIINPLGEKNSFIYSETGLLTKMIDPGGFVHTYEFNPSSNLISETNPSGGYTKLSHSGTGNDFTVTLTSASGRSSKYRVINKTGGITEKIVTFPDGSINSETKWKDGKELVKYANGITEMRTAQSYLTGNHLTPLPDLVTITLPGGLISTTTIKRTITLANPINPLSVSSLVDNVDHNGAIAKSFYTGSTQTLKELSPLGRLRTTMFDKNGKIIKRQIAGLSPMTFAYDDIGRLVLSGEGTGTETRQFRYSYDGAGNLATITDPLGRITNFHYDATGQKTQVILPGGSTISFAYDAAGNITNLKTPGKIDHEFEYNAAGLLAKYTSPGLDNASNSTTYKYNTDNQLTDVILPDGKTISFSYDFGSCACGKLNRIKEPRGIHNYTYNKTTGLLSSISSPGDVVLSFAYNGGFLTTETWSGPIHGKVQDEYDNNFRVVSRKVNDAMPIIYKTDLDGLLIKAGKMLLQRNQQNGYITGIKLEKISENISYNDFAKKMSSVASFGTTSLYNGQYKHDKLGRIVSKTETIGDVTDDWEYDYDQLGRLAVVRNGKKTTKYNYDENGNRLTLVIDGGVPLTATYDEQDRLLQFGNIVYTYTVEGDLLSKSDGTTTTKYEYDVFGNLVKVILPDSKVIDYIIDDNSRRIGRKINGVLQKGFLYQDDLRIVAELDNKNNVKSRFVYASRMYVPDLMIRDGITYRIISDNTGSPRLIVDAMTGKIVQQINYDEFGNVMEDSNPGFQPFGFAGGVYDADTKLTRFGARDYDAATGRWTTKDPILFGGYQPNLYAYVANDPLNQKDPTGRGVRVCRQTLLTVEFPKGLSHWWLETSTVKQGMGTSKDGGPLSVEWVDQSYKYGFKQEKIICEDYPTVDEECVNANTKGSLGTYGFIVNNCQTAVIEVLKKCDRAPKPPPPAPKAPGGPGRRW